MRCVNAHVTYAAEAWQQQLVAAMTAAGVQAVRLDAPWNVLEPEQGRYAPQLANLDHAVAALAAAGIRVLLVPAYTPGWANGGKASNIPPDDPASFAAFCQFLAGRYYPNVEAIEVWNEPDLNYSWATSTGTVQQRARTYVELLKAAHPAIKLANADCLVLAPATGSISDPGYMTAFFAAGPKGSFDRVSMHLYGDPPSHGGLTPEQTAGRWWQNVGAIVHQNEGAGMKWWITETGWNTVGVTDQEQAACLTGIYQQLAKVTKAHWCSQIERTYWYEFNDDAAAPNAAQAYGICTLGLQPKPTAAAFTALT